MFKVLAELVVVGVFFIPEDARLVNILPGQLMPLDPDEANDRLVAEGRYFLLLWRGLWLDSFGPHKRSDISNHRTLHFRAFGLLCCRVDQRDIDIVLQVRQH